MPASKKKTDETELDEAPAEETSADQPLEASAAPATADAPTGDAAPARPRPWRVETFQIAEEGWGWRLCSADGVIISETEPRFGDRDEALAAADDDGQTEGARFLDRERSRRW